MTNTNAVARRVVEAGVSDPYDGNDPANRLPAVVRQSDLEMARRSPVGKIVLAEDSVFLQLAAAAGINAPAMAIELASAASKNPDILKCTRESIWSFCLDAAKLDLRIGRGIYPVAIPHKKDTPQEQWRLEGWVGYKGAKELAARGGIIRDAWATVHFEGDEFVMNQVPVPTVERHVFGPNKGNMEKALGVYCTLLYPGHKTRVRYFDRAKIESYRKRNPTNTWKTSPWKTNEEEMWQAKAILHTTGDLPHTSPELKYLGQLLAREESRAIAALPPAEAVHPDEGDEAGDTPVLPGQEEPQPKTKPEPTPEQKLRAAHSVAIKFRSGHVRMLSEIRNGQLERLLQAYRERLQEDPDNDELVHQASAIAYVLDARKDGRSTEPAAPPEV